MARFPRDYNPDNGAPWDRQPPLPQPELRFSEPVGDPWPDPNEPPGCPYQERCRLAMGLPPELLCGFATIWVGEHREWAGWTTCPRAQDYDAAVLPQEATDAER